jgi:hypothetical protein
VPEYYSPAVVSEGTREGCETIRIKTRTKGGGGRTRKRREEKGREREATKSRAESLVAVAHGGWWV